MTEYPIQLNATDGTPVVAVVHHLVEDLDGLPAGMVHTEEPPALPHLSRHADHTHLHHEAWHRERERRTTWQLSWLDDPDDGGEDDGEDDDENGDS